MKLKRIVAVLLSITIIISMFINLPTNAVAQEKNFSAKYSGLYNGSDDFEFSIFSVDIYSENFTGHLYINGLFVLDKSISGTIVLYDDYYVCNFSFTYRYITTYTASFEITVYPSQGIAYGSGGGGFLFFDDNFPLTGTVDKFYNKNLSYHENDMKMCMYLSNAIYYGQDKLNDKLSDYSLNFSSAKKIINEDDNPNNVLFSILIRKYTSNNYIDIVVVIRGTYKDEWQGNVQITGTSYNPDEAVHDNFYKAKESIEDEILDYYNEFCNGYDKVNLIITGHSRGAAVSNLYAKEATDVMNGSATNDKIPVFDDVTAYTFACPNVEKYNSSMESYTNIFNFWFDTDIVPTVPLTSPTDGWDYWKYGRCYTMDISSLCNWSFSLDKKFFSVYISGPLNKNIKSEMSLAFSQWESVDDYYNKVLSDNFVLGFNDIIDIIFDNTTLYNFLYTATYFFKTSKISKLFGINAIRDATNSSKLTPLISFAVNNIGTIYKSHHNDTYNYFINGEGADLEQFTPYYYSDAVSSNIIYTYSATESLPDNAIMSLLEDDSTTDSTYNFYEVQQMKLFANFGDNNDILGWDLEDPSTWEGITWDNEGHISQIDFTYKWLTGNLNCSDFTGLKSINVYANSISSINLSGDVNLESLNCCYNDLSLNGLDLSECTALKELYCDGCALSSLNLTELADLQTLSCGFNNLIALNIEENANLTHISCPYNYLDIHKGGALYTKLYEYQSTNNAYINYYPQSLPNDAVINTDELQALEDFAKYGDNNLALDWLDEDGVISIDKVQNNALFEFDGEKYRIVAMDISEYDVAGTLDLSAFSYLRYFYCNDTDIAEINTVNCTGLEILDCSNCELNNLILPNNASADSSPLIFLNCENNHLDINIFTDDIVNNIASKGEINYRHQLINAEISDFDDEDYAALLRFANQKSNLDILKWDLDNPGYWEQVNWKLDTSTNKYCLLDCYFQYLETEGSLDLSECENIENYSFSGSYISTVTLPPAEVKDNAFYNCLRLEAVILSEGTTKIGYQAFRFCEALQAVYIPESVTTIDDTAFDDCDNLTLSGAENSYAYIFATENNISFISGYFICGNVVTKENAQGTINNYYPVENVELIDDENNVVSASDEYGYFVLFGLNNSVYNHSLTYAYGYDLTLESYVTDSSMIILTPIQMITYDFVKDGYINAKDYSLFLIMLDKDNSDENYQYFDIDKNGAVNEDDWCFAQQFLLSNNSIKETIQAGERTTYSVAPMSLFATEFNNENNNSNTNADICIGSENIDAGWD